MEGDVAKLLRAIRRGDVVESDELLRAVRDELCQLASEKLARMNPGDTLAATAVVQEAFLRLGTTGEPWPNRQRFFLTAAEAMRRILVVSALRKRNAKQGSEQRQLDWEWRLIGPSHLCDDILVLDAAFERLECFDDQAALLAKCRYFAGLSIEEASEVLHVSSSTGERIWAFAKAWLHQEMYGAPPPDD